MIKRLLLPLLSKNKQESGLNQEEFLFASICQQFDNKTLIIHAGLESNWLEELLKQPGGGGHFRVNCTTFSNQPTATERFVQTFIEPLGLPKPIFLKISGGNVWVRHLLSGERFVLPSDVSWIQGEIETRFHYRLGCNANGKIESVSGLAVTENSIDYSFE